MDSEVGRAEGATESCKVTLQHSATSIKVCTGKGARSAFCTRLAGKQLGWKMELPTKELELLGQVGRVERETHSCEALKAFVGDCKDRERC